MKKIGILALSTPHHGGTFQYTLSTIHALKKLSQFECVIFTHSHISDYDDLGVPIVRIGAARAVTSLLRSRLGRNSDRDIFRGMDIVIAPIYSTYLMATSKPYAFTLHDLQEKYYPGNFTLLQKCWREFTNRFLIRNAAAVICESQYVKQDIVRYYSPPSEKIHVIPAPPAISGHSAAASEIEIIKNKYSLPNKYFFYPAQFWPHKNHERLILAFSSIATELPEAQLVLTGKKRNEYPRIHSLIKQLGLQQRVVHIEYVAQEDMPVIYQLAHAAIIPTLFESISIPAYEAFFMGVPVCISNVVAIPEQVGDAALLFSPTSIGEMASCMKQIWEDQSLRDRLVANGRARLEIVTPASYANHLCVLVSALMEKP